MVGLKTCTYITMLSRIREADDWKRYETTAYIRPTSAREVMLLFLLVGLPVCPPDYLKNNERICMKMEMIRITIRIQDPDYDH